MYNKFKKALAFFYRLPILTTVVLTLASSLLLGVAMQFLNFFQAKINLSPGNIIGGILIYSILILPFILTIENIILLFVKSTDEVKESALIIWELVAILIGIVYTLTYSSLINIRFMDWQEQLNNSEVHSPIATKTLPSLVFILALAFIGYLILRSVPLEKLAPLFAVLCISAIYLGIGLSILWCIQIYDFKTMDTVFLSLLPLNLIIIFLRTIRHTIHQHARKIDDDSKIEGFMGKLLKDSKNWPWLAFIFAIPLLGLIVALLTLFGQRPDDIIKAWTETSDWNMSQKVSPQNVFFDEHYLCTVAAGGHPKVVKPIRYGKRHGNRVIVNRQLCIANAFEDLIQEKLPRSHKLIRKIYDSLGYPIARHIKSPYTADLVYYLMKPLEWVFLLSLYLFDLKPENRIAVQYPHSEIPKN